LVLVNEKRFRTRGSFKVEENIDLEECHQTPIHNTALIQPHGALVELDDQSRTIRSASANLEEYLSADLQDVSGQSLEALLDSAEVE
jgi:light-regulated signal transduction histidine kinase (bacteriophytochrome)